MNNEIKEILEIDENADYKRLSIDEIATLNTYINNTEEMMNYYFKKQKHYHSIINKIIKYMADFEWDNMKRNPDFKEIWNILEGDNNE